MSEIAYLRCGSCDFEFQYDPDDMDEDGRCPHGCDDKDG